MARTLKDLVWQLQQTHGEEATQGLQVIGILEQSVAWQIFGLQQHNYVSVKEEVEKYRKGVPKGSTERGSSV